jgi:hypothetical protein
MKAEPLSKEIYDMATSLNVETITLYFSGGSDVGYLDIEIEKEDSSNFHSGYSSESNSFEGTDKLSNLIENWAWLVYTYNGAGEGIDFGDNIIYDLKNKTVNTHEWYHERIEKTSPNTTLKIEK